MAFVEKNAIIFFVKKRKTIIYINFLFFVNKKKKLQKKDLRVHF
jgi:hypothetical protein